MKTNKLFKLHTHIATAPTLAWLRFAALGLALLLPASLLAGLVTNTFTSSSTFTPPAGVTSISVAVQGGGGGGGGGGPTTSGRGGGGGGGACAYNSALTVDPAVAYTVTVGAGGTAGAATTGTGGTGGVTSFSGGVITALTANGGAGGALGGVNGSTVPAGGTASGGTVNYAGGAGTVCKASTASGGGGGGAGTTQVGQPGVTYTGGAGGTGSPAGGAGGGNPNTGSQAGTSGTAPGGGGGGGYTGSTTKAGGAGARGQVTIVYTLPDPILVVKADNTQDLTNTLSWVGGVVPTVYDFAVWDITVTGANTTSLGANTTWAGIQIQNPVGLVTINAGNTLTLGGAVNGNIIMTNATTDLTLNCDVALGAANDWDVTNGQTLTVSGVVSGAGALNKLGAGTVTLSGANTFTNKLTVTDGTLNLTGNRTVAATAAQSIDVGGTGIPLATVNVGGDLPLGATQWRVGVNGPGTVNQTNGLTSFTGGTQLTVGITAGMPGVYNLSGGSLTMASQSNRGLLLGLNASSDGTFNLSGSGLLTMASGSSLHVCRAENVAATGATGTFNQSGGTATVTDLRVGGNTAVNNANQIATMNLSGGTFTASGFTALSGGNGSVSTINISNVADVTLPAFPTTRGSGATATITFDGGTLRNYAASPTYMGGLDNAYIRAGGARFNTDNGSITIAQPLLEDSGSPGGGLIKEGANTLTLTGTPTYTGPTTVNAGTLVVPSTHTGTNAATVAANAALGVTASGASQWPPASLTLANPCALEFNSVQNPGTTIAPISPTTGPGTVANVTVHIHSLVGTVLVNNSYPLLGQVSATNGYALGTQPPGVTGHLAVDTGTLVYVVDSAADVWTGADVTQPTWWDITNSLNWTGKALINMPSGSYAEGDGVLFDDTATPASPVTVDLQTNVAPGIMIFANDTKDYIVTNSSGINGIGGSGSLTKSGTGILTLASSNTYSGATVISAGTLDLTGSLSNSPVTVSGSAVLTQAASGSIGGAVALTHSSSGISTLAGANTYSGGTYFTSSGVLALAHGSAAGSGPINFASTQTGTASTFTLSGGINVTNAIVMDAATGRNTINVTGGDNTLSGNMTINNNAANQVVFNNSGAAGTTFTVGGATPNSTTITASTFANFLSFRATTNGALGTLNSQINAPSAQFNANNNGLWTINSTGNNWATTVFSSAAASFILGANDALATGAYVSFTAATTGYLDLNGKNQTVAGLAGGNITNSVYNITNAGVSDSILTLSGLTTNRSFSGNIGDGGAGKSISLVMNSGGFTQTLSGNNTYTGGTTISAGTLQIGSGSTAGSIDSTAGVTNNGALVYNRSGTVTPGYVISGSGSLTNLGSGTVSLTNANTYTGTTTLSAGTLSLGHTNALQNTSGISMAAGTILSAAAGTNTTTKIDAPITLAGTGNTTLRIGSGAASTTAAFTLNGAIGGTTSNLVFTTTTGSFNNGSSVFALGAAGNYTGDTVITTGNGVNNPVVVKAGAGIINALPATTVLSFGQVAGGGSGRALTYDLNGNNQTLAGLDNGGTVPTERNMIVKSTTAATLTISNTANFTFGGASLSGDGDTGRARFEGALALTKDGAGTFTLGGTLTGGATAQGNVNTGGTKILGGILVLGESTSLRNSVLDTAGSVAGDAGNGLRTTVTTLTLGGLTGNKNLASVFTTTAGGYDTVTALTLNSGAGVTNSYSAAIADGAAGMTLTKSGAGTQILTGVQAYTGATAVNAGTLLVNSPGSLSASSAVTVNTNGTLGGNGTLNGPVTVADGGNLAPGASIGTLTLNGNVVLNAGSTNTFEVDGSTPTHDVIVLGAAVTYGGVLNIVPTGTFTNGQTFTLFSGLGATSPSNFDSLVVNPPVSGTSFTFTNGVLTAVVASGPTGPATLTNSYSGGSLSLSWPAGEGWRLQMQTNSLAVGLFTNWTYITDGSISSTNITPDSMLPTVFYRLMYP